MKVTREAFQQNETLVRNQVGEVPLSKLWYSKTLGPAPDYVVVTYERVEDDPGFLARWCELRVIECVLPTHVHEAATFSTNGIC